MRKNIDKHVSIERCNKHSARMEDLAPSTVKSSLNADGSVETTLQSNVVVAHWDVV